jgi:hypothetical protein
VLALEHAWPVWVVPELPELPELEPIFALLLLPEHAPTTSAAKAIHRVRISGS